MFIYNLYTLLRRACITKISIRTDAKSVLLHVCGVQEGCMPLCVIYARPHIPVIPDFPSDIPADYWNFVYLVSHCVWDLLSTCETRSVPVRGEAASCSNADMFSRIMRAGIQPIRLKKDH